MESSPVSRTAGRSHVVLTSHTAIDPVSLPGLPVMLVTLANTEEPSTSGERQAISFTYDSDREDKSRP